MKRPNKIHGGRMQMQKSTDPVRILLTIVALCLSGLGGCNRANTQKVDETPATGDAQVFTSVVVASELRFGARKKDSSVLTDRVDQLLASIEVAPLEIGVDRIYADIRQALESSGQLIGANDLFIAAHALEQEATLVTDNVAEFERVPGLQIENWLRSS